MREVNDKGTPIDNENVGVSTLIVIIFASAFGVQNDIVLLPTTSFMLTGQGDRFAGIFVCGHVGLCIGKESSKLTGKALDNRWKFVRQVV